MFGHAFFGAEYFGARYFGPAAGGGAPVFTAEYVTVRATAVGYYGDRLRAVGDEFEIMTPEAFHPSWMVLVDDPPVDWDAEIEARNILAENLRIEFRGRVETRTTEDAFGV